MCRPTGMSLSKSPAMGVRGLVKSRSTMVDTRRETTGQKRRKPHISKGLKYIGVGNPEARRLVELRDRWLNPPEWVEWVDEPVPGYPKWPIPRDEDPAKAL